MKVVLFCGGQGMRLREYNDHVPKPMVPIGYRPILWHVMRYYAHFGHRDFILCLGYRGDVIKDYFLKYSEALTNDFVLTDGGRNIELLGADISDWRVTFAETGAQANIAQRLLAVRKYIGDDGVFLANYSDGLTDLPLSEQLADFSQSGKIAGFVCARPHVSYHFVTLRSDGAIDRMQTAAESNLRINGGYFAFRREVFDYIRDGEELVVEPFRRLAAADQLRAYPYDGFWMSMDTFKEKQALDEMYSRGTPPWQVWSRQT